MFTSRCLGSWSMTMRPIWILAARSGTRQKHFDAVNGRQAEIGVLDALVLQ